MTPPAAPTRALLRAFAAAVAFLVLTAPAGAKDPEVDNFDARPIGDGKLPAEVEHAGERLRERLGRFGTLSIDDRTGTLRSVGRLDGFLTGPSGGDSADIALGYTRDNATAFGLDASDVNELRLVDRDFVQGVEHLAWEQRYRGIPAADAGLNAAVTGSGRLLNVTGPPATDLAVRSVEPSVSAAAAYVAARASAGDPGADVSIERRTGGAEELTYFSDGGRASLTLYRASSGHRLAWRVLAPVSSTGVYDLLIDARTAATVRRVNHVKFAAPADVFRYNPSNGGPVAIDLAPWLTSSSKLEGPNAHAFLDSHDTVGPQADGSFQLTPEAGSDIAPESGNYRFPLTTVPHHNDDECPGTGTTFPSSVCTWNPLVPDSWKVNAKQSATQLFYLVNTFHDYLRDDPAIAFVAGGFRRNPGQPLGDPNLGARPDASDPVLAQALDGADTASGLPDADHVNNANFLTLPDGYPGLMQMYLWSPEDFGAYDGANDAATVFHEYAHGLSGRLVSDAGGFEALSSAQAGAMSEGWSDFYALDFLAQQGLQTDAAGTADVRFGRYFDNGTGARVRVQPIDCSPASLSPCSSGGGPAGSGHFTYADFGQIANGGPEFHDDGEIWGQTLWSLRTALITAHGSAGGIARTRRYVTQAMRISPQEPSFLDMRNAILQASTEEADDARIWKVFADRGMGYFATTDGGEDVAPMADFTDPTTLTGETIVTGVVEDDENAPVEDAEVGISGLGDELIDYTDAGGNYRLAVPVPEAGNHTYPALRARKPAYAEATEPNVELTDGVARTIGFELERDWSSAVGGATVEGFTGEDNADDGCGPGGLIDDDPGTVWGTDNTVGGQQIVVDLGTPIDVERIAIDPAAGCGDDSSAALGVYELRGSTGADGPFTQLSSGNFSAGNNGTLNTAFTGPASRIRFVTLFARTSQNNAPGRDGARFIDVAELHVARTPFSVVGPTADTGDSRDLTASGATLTGTVVPNQAATDVVFQYGATSAYGFEVSVGALEASQTASNVSAVVAGLEPSRTYHYRVVSRSGGHTYPGVDKTFTTGASPPPPDGGGEGGGTGGGGTTTSPPPSSPPPPVAIQLPPVVLTTLPDLKLTADRKGYFKVKTLFGATASAGNARFTVKSGKRRLARARTVVRQGRTVTKTLRLSKKGRRAIKPGRTKKVKLRLQLPGGAQVEKTLKLTRKRR